MQLMKLIIIFGRFGIDPDPDSNLNSSQPESGSETYFRPEPDPSQKFRIRNTGFWEIFSELKKCCCMQVRNSFIVPATHLLQYMSKINTVQ